MAYGDKKRPGEGPFLIDDLYTEGKNKGRPKILVMARDADVVYAEPISIRVLQTHTFGDSTVIVPPTRREPFDNEHKFYVTFPVDGEYIIELSIMVEGKLEVIPFLMVAGDPTAATSVFVAAASLLVVGFIVVRAMQVKQRRRLGQAGSHPRAGVPHGAVAQPVL